MRIEISLPSLGDDDDAVQGAVVTGWLAKIGDALSEGDDLLEITTDKAAFVVPAPQAGRLIEQLVEEGNGIRVGEPIAVIET